MIETYIKVEVKDKRGRTLSSEQHPSRSFLRGYNHLICQQMICERFPSPYVNTKDTGGTGRNLSWAEDRLRCNAAINVTTYGIVIGTDNTPVDIEQWALIAKINNGVAAGQMEYQAVTFNDLGVVGNICSFEVARIMDNNSGGAILVQEAAIYGFGADYMLTNRYFCLARDVINENVLDGNSITVTYTVRVVA